MAHGSRNQSLTTMCYQLLQKKSFLQSMNLYEKNYNSRKWYFRVVYSKFIKKRLIEWQNTNYGFTDGINGNLRYPKFNLKPMEEE